MDSLSKAILATVIYYDVLDFPLTHLEVLNLLVNPKRFEENLMRGMEDTVFETFLDKNHVSQKILEVINILDLMVKDGQIDQFNGFYFLPGRKNLYHQRMEKNKISEQKWRKTRRYLFLAQAVPFIEAVFASGSLALGSANEESDLDVLVVAKSGRIWLARIFISLAMSILGVRRKNKERLAPNKICLNHYITSQSLKISFESLYNAQSYAHLIPVYWQDKKIVERFWEENRGWIEKFLCRWECPYYYQKRAIRKSRFLNLFKTSLEKILEISRLADWLEKLSKKVQVFRIDSTLPGRIVVNDRQLEFHPYSAEKDILKKYNQTIFDSGIFGGYHEIDSGLR